MTIPGVILSAILAACLTAAAADLETQKQPQDGSEPLPPQRALSGAAAADEARIYTAELKRCEGLDGPRRADCVETARKRLGQL
jgi:hypothetical protein